MASRSAAGVLTSTATLDTSFPFSELAPRVVGILRDLFKNWSGLDESRFLVETVSGMSIPKVAAEVARQLRRFHQVEVPGSKEPQLWNDIFKFFHKASSLKFDDSKKQKMYDTISFDEVHNALIELKISSNDLEALYVETDTFKLASHMYWALWGLIQAKVSPIEFDYLEYFFLRYFEFKKQKETTITRAREYLGIVSTGAP